LPRSSTDSTCLPSGIRDCSCRGWRLPGRQSRASASANRSPFSAQPSRMRSARRSIITLEVPDWPGHVAGQHVDVRLTAEDGYSAVRSYSIASAPGSDGRVQITVERLPDGEVSPYLTRELAVGDRLDLRGPIGGWFVWRTQQAEQQAERSQDAPLPWTPRAVEDAPPEADGVPVTVSIDEHFRALARGAVASARDAILDIPEADRSDHRRPPRARCSRAFRPTGFHRRTLRPG
jgi:FAD-dependent oxidoreductase family protein